MNDSACLVMLKKPLLIAPPEAEQFTPGTKPMLNKIRGTYEGWKVGKSILSHLSDPTVTQSDI